MLRLFTYVVGVFVLIVSSSTVILGQDHEDDYVDTTTVNANFWDKVFVGGNIGAQFGRITFVDLSPNIGIYLTKNRRLSAGLGITYQYLNVNDDGTKYDTHTFGGRLFGRYIIWKGITAQAEFEMLSLECYRQYYGLQRKGIPGLLLGGGYTQSIGSRVGISFLVFYNFIESECTPYRNPVFRLGFNIGL
ncbi:MAG: hypothetical protein ACI9FU_001519 [Granulosicoccus sp.]|jgi:hypothetical protein